MTKRGLYAIADADAVKRAGLDLVECARALAQAPIAAVQVRAKGMPASELTRLLEPLLDRWPEGAPPLFVNDRADVAAALRAHGVHVGQGDFPARLVRAHFPELLVGVSTHDEEQLNRALAMDKPSATKLDYVAFGPVFSTASKQNPDPVVGVAGLKRAAELAAAAGVPLVAIGGITSERLEAVAGLADMIAAISLLYEGVSGVRPYAALARRCTELEKRIAQVELQARDSF